MDNEKIVETTASVTFNYCTEKDYQWEYYMKRKSKLYFRSNFSEKIVIDLNYIPEELNDMKYGTKVDITWDDN